MALGQDTSDNVVRSIGFQDGIQSRVDMFEDRRRTEAGLEFLKHLLVGRCPFDMDFIGTLLVGNGSRLSGLTVFNRLNSGVQICEYPSMNCR